MNQADYAGSGHVFGLSHSFDQSDWRAARLRVQHQVARPMASQAEETLSGEAKSVVTGAVFKEIQHLAEQAQLQ